jgi:hypothetical protein
MTLVTASSSSMANNTSVDYFMFPLVFINGQCRTLRPKGPPCWYCTKLTSMQREFKNISTDQKLETLTNGWAWHKIKAVSEPTNR